MSDDTPIPVTRPTLPPLEEYLPYLEQIWQSRQLTNSGPFHQRLERELAAYLEVPFISLYANGTLALIAALKVLELEGEVITTPFTFAATAHAIVWAGLTPVFADIDPRTCNLDPHRVAAAITPHTSAILPVHCYGNPCDVDAFRDLSRRHGIPVVYDAAHAFGVRYRGENLVAHGDLAVLSFHATKVFNTVEGGAVVCHDAEMKARLDAFRNFGFDQPGVSSGPGVNGKLNELQAALGLAQLPTVGKAIEQRRRLAATYRRALADCSGVTPLPEPADTESNHAYFPVLVNERAGIDRDELISRLERAGIFARRYFHPLVCDMEAFARFAPPAVAMARDISGRIACLPLFPEMSERDVIRVSEAVCSQ